MMAIIMAGGKATRFRRPTEKAVLEVGGRTLLERSSDALHIPGVDRVMAAVSPHTSRTEELANRLGIEVLRTRGEGYHEDVLQLMDELGPFISLNVDVPFVTKGHVKEMVNRTEEGSLTAVVHEGLALRRPDRESVMTDSSGRGLIWVGLNIVRPVPEIELIEYDDPLLTVNINDGEDLAFAEEIAKRYGR